MLSQVSGGQEGTGVETLPWKFDNLLGFDPASVHKLEALQVDDLKSRAWRLLSLLFLHHSHSLRATDQNRRQPPEVQFLGG